MDIRTLWRVEHQRDAYKDQFGKKHPGYVVQEEATVTIVERRDVRDVWNDEVHKDAGWKACDTSGREYFCNWDSFPSDSTTPNFYWYSDNPPEEWVDAVQATSWSLAIGPYVTATGEAMKPANSWYCEKHKQWSYNECVCFYCKCNIPVDRS